MYKIIYLLSALVYLASAGCSCDKSGRRVKCTGIFGQRDIGIACPKEKPALILRFPVPASTICRMNWNTLLGSL